jgi:energy-coupling factor transporter ATP-binding protein EcfA2
MNTRTVELGGIVRIATRRLLGQFDYDLSLRDRSPDARRLVILYGENGSGKTTILRLLYSLLSDHASQGNRGRIGNTRFESFEVELDDGTVVTAARSRTSAPGDYRLTLVHGGTVLCDGTVVMASDGSIDSSDGTTEHFVARLRELKLSVGFVPEDRRYLVSSRLDPESIESPPPAPHRVGARRRSEPLDAAALIGVVVRLFEERIRRRVFRSARNAERGSNSVYVQVARELAAAKMGLAEYPEHYAQLVERLNEVVGRADGFAKFELIDKSGLEELLDIYVNASSQTTPSIARVLGPFVDGMLVRMKALESVRSSLDGFLTDLNEYLYLKKATFRVREGLVIRAYNGDPVPPGQLSSGERQLLLMFCALSLFDSQRRIFLLDEPEISLNIKWQRRLLSSFLGLSSSARQQLVVASHSVDVISPHQDAVWELSQ